MIQIQIPGWKELTLHHLVLDYNGTIAVDGRLLQSIRPLLSHLASQLTIHVLTSDTRGTARRELAGLPVILETFEGDAASIAKEAVVNRLGADSCVCIGNGRNDTRMFQAAALAIAVLEEEGTCASLIPHAHMLVRSSQDALRLLFDPQRLIAGLRG